MICKRAQICAASVIKYGVNGIIDKRRSPDRVTSDNIVVNCGKADIAMSCTNKGKNIAVRCKSFVIPSSYAVICILPIKLFAVRSAADVPACERIADL